jgi:hypothetical protein
MLGSTTEVRRPALIALAATACGRLHFGTPSPDARLTDARPPDTLGDDAPAGPGLVQQTTTSAEAGTSLTATLPAPPHAGDLLVMVGAIQSEGLDTVTGAGVTWQLAHAETTRANVEIWYGITDGSDSTVQIAATLTGELWISFEEWRGVTAVLDAQNGMSGVMNPASAGAITCGATGDLVILGVADNLPNTFGTPGAATWTALAPPATSSHIEQPWYTFSAPAQMLAPTVTETGGSWGAAIAAFRVAP